MIINCKNIPSIIYDTEYHTGIIYSPKYRKYSTSLFYNIAAIKLIRSWIIYNGYYPYPRWPSVITFMQLKWLV